MCPVSSCFHFLPFCFCRRSKNRNRKGINQQTTSFSQCSHSNSNGCCNCSFVATPTRFSFAIVSTHSLRSSSRVLRFVFLFHLLQFFALLRISAMHFFSLLLYCRRHSIVDVNSVLIVIFRFFICR